MKNAKQKLELWFAGWAGLFYDHKMKTVLSLLVLIVLLLSQLPKLRMETSVESFFYEDDQYLTDYFDFKDQFGRDDYAVIGIKSAEIFSLDFLNRLKAFHEELEKQVPYLSEIESMINIRHTRGEGDELIIEELTQDWPENEQDLETFKRRLLSNPVYRNTIISENGTLTAMILKSELISPPAELAEDFSEDIQLDVENQDNGQSNKFLTDLENAKFIQAIYEIAAQYDQDDFDVYVTGSAVLAHELRYTIAEENKIFATLALLILLGLLLYLFKRVSGALIPLFVVILASVSTFSVLALIGQPMTLVTQILPIFLLVVGVGDTIHVLALFYRQFDRSGDKRGAMVYAVGHSGLAVLMTSLTTAAGLLSFLSAEMAPIAHFGITGAFGVMVAFVYTVVLLPALVALIPMKPRNYGKRAIKESRMDSVLRKIGRFSVHHRNVVFLCSLILILFSVWGITKLRFSHNDLDAFSKSGDFYISTKMIDRELKGSVVMEVILDTGQENGIQEPEFLKKLDESEGIIREMTVGELFVGKTLSIVPILKETNRALNQNSDMAYRVPDERDLIAQELFLFESGGADDLQRVTDTRFSMARLTIKAPFADAWQYVELIEKVEKHLQLQFPDTTFSITGLMMLFAQALKKLIVSLVDSYIIVFIVVTILMVILIGRWRIGLVSMLPNIFPVAVILGIMGWLGVPVDFFNIMLGSLVVGIAVDNTIHFFHNFRKYFEETGDSTLAVEKTFETTGRAMITTAIVLCAGFYIYLLSELNGLFIFGALTGSAILLALVADFLLAPALLTVFNPATAKNRIATVKV